MPTASEQATRFASRPTAGWWDDRVRAEYGYTLHRIRHGHNAEAEWARLERRLLTLCRTHERNEAA